MALSDETTLADRMRVVLEVVVGVTPDEFEQLRETPAADAQDVQEE